MIATIAVIAAIAEKKKFSDRSDNNRWDIKSSISAIVVAAIAGEWFPYDRLTFFLTEHSDHSDRSDHMETGLNLSQ